MRPPGPRTFAFVFSRLAVLVLMLPRPAHSQDKCPSGAAVGSGKATGMRDRCIQDLWTFYLMLLSTQNDLKIKVVFKREFK